MMHGPILFVAMVGGVILFILLLVELCSGDKPDAKPDSALDAADALSREVAELKRRLVLEKGRSA